LTNIDQIEINSSEAYQVNGIGAKNVSVISNREKIKLIHISTDSVFDGKKGMYDENDSPFPINEYAKSKKMGEDYVKEICDRYVIIRTNFYGYNKQGNNLFNWVLTNLKNNKPITGFYDVFFNPLEVENLSMIIIELILSGFDGVIHLSSDDVMSKYQYALKIAEILDLDKSLLIKGSILNSNLLAKRPLNTTLSNVKAKKILKTPLISLDDWLRHKSAEFCS
jgi:dTDP-4-dehydrorhamnose reductase